jgi:hypothetical protein
MFDRIDDNYVEREQRYEQQGNQRDGRSQIKLVHERIRERFILFVFLELFIRGVYRYAQANANDKCDDCHRSRIITFRGTEHRSKPKHASQNYKQGEDKEVRSFEDNVFLGQFFTTHNVRNHSSPTSPAI